jgi:hypothetical protein
MDLVARTRFWRGLGWAMNTRVGTRLLDGIGGVMGKAVAHAPAPPPDTALPWTPFAGTLAASRVSVVVTAGLYLDGQEPFDVDAADGDPTFRELPSDLAWKDLRIAHPHFSHRRFREDPNVILPLDRLRELVAAGVLGGLAPRFFSFGFGGLIRGAGESPYRREVARRMRADGADLALLVPA